MNVLELFSGIGGIGLALERAGATVVGACEIDGAARGVYADHWPDVPLFPDVTEMTPDDLGTTRVDLIAAGFPCQDLSVAGRRAGLRGARSGLFWHIVRLADALRPRWLVLENVPGLLSAVCPCPGDDSCVLNGHSEIGECAGALHPVNGGACRGGCMAVHGGAMGAILGALGDIGYGFAYRVLDAQHFGVPQRRRRVFIVGCLGDGAAPVEVLLEPESSGRNPAPGRAARPRVAATLTSGSHRSRGPGRRAEDDVNLVVPAVTAKWAKHSGGPAGDEAQNLVAQPYGVSAADPDIAGTLVSNVDGGLRTTDISGAYVAFDAAQITHPENRVNPQPGDPAMPLAATGQPMVAHALTAEGHDASEDGTGRGTPIVPYAIEPETGQGADLRARPVEISPAFTATSEAKATDRGVRVVTATAVRRLTPLECERLQGFPDGWTATSNGKPQADSPRYRQLGNAVAVPVVEWIARRLVEASA